MPMFLLVLFLIVILMMTYSLSMSIITSGKGVEYLVSKPVPVDTPYQALDSENTRKKLLSSGGSTFAGFFNVRLGDRTQGAKMIQLVGIKGALVFEISPAVTQLRVSTTERQEIIPLPNFPLQKWIFLSILRDGRRFDVMYNDRIVASHRLDKYPSPVSNPLMIGSKELLGSAVNVLVNDKRMSPSEILALRNSLADTNGSPPDKMSFPLPNVLADSIKNLQVACIPGMGCNPVTSPPPNRMKSWDSLYN